MRIVILFILSSFLFISCQNNTTSNTQQPSEASKSPEYKAYITAYNDFVNCVGARPQLTNDLLSKKIDGAQFEELLDKNTKLCDLKRKLYLTHFEILEATYPNEAATLRLGTDLGQ